LASHLPAPAGLFVAAERKGGIENVVTIDPDGPGAKQAGDLMRATEIAGPDAGRESVRALIRGGGDLRGIAKRDRAHHGAENLLLHDAHFGPGLDKYGLKLVADEVYTAPISDASPIAQKVRASRPDFLLFLPTVASDTKTVLEKLSEVGLGRNRLPVVSNGAPVGSPDLLKIAGKDAMEGVMFITANWGFKGLEDFIKHFKEVTGEPYLTQDSISNYGHVWILKEAIERAGSADRRKVSEELHQIDLTDGPARFFPGNRIKFDEKGRRVGATLLIAQWQNGEPVAVYPPEAAFAKPVWSKQ